MLQLNFEIDSRNAKLSTFTKYDEFAVKANAYDKKGNLISIEEKSFDYSELESGYLADYLYFMDDSMIDAYSLRVYARHHSAD